MGFNSGFKGLILQFLTPSLSASLITPSIHLRFGLPTRLLPSGLSKVIFLHGRLSCIRTKCPAHLSLVILTVVTKSVSSYRRYTSSLYLASTIYRQKIVQTPGKEKWELRGKEIQACPYTRLAKSIRPRPPPAPGSSMYQSCVIVRYTDTFFLKLYTEASLVEQDTFCVMRLITPLSFQES